MSRIIKFRVWDKSAKRFLGENDDFLLSPDGQIWWIDCREKVYTNDLDIYIIQQFTGLLDKNHKEIYEGDILERIHGIKQEKVSYGEVKFGKRSAQNEDGEECVGFYIDYRDWISILLPEVNYCTVIGNIFETPLDELTKQAQELNLYQ